MSITNFSFDVVFLGGGPAGYHASIFAAKKGLLAAVVEKDLLGGTCLNRGCIPTKVLHASAEALHSTREGARFGFKLDGTAVPDMAAVADRKDAIVKKLREGVAGLFKGNGIELFSGEGRVAEGGVVVRAAAGGEAFVSARNVVVCTGSRPASLPGITVDHKIVLDSDDAVSLREVPQSVLIVGGGVIGCEFADLLNRFGSQVTVVELLPRILSTEDATAARAVAKSFAARGITVITDVHVGSLEAKDGTATVSLSDGKRIEVSRVLVSVGRRSNTEGLGIDAHVDPKGSIKIDSRMRTAKSGLYAAGDCIGGLMLAHVASREAETAVANILGREMEMRYDAIPSCVFTSPEVASVGMTEDAARQKGIDVSLGRFFAQANGQALALGDDEGFVKIVAEKGTGQLMGAVVVGKGASTMIAELALAVAHKMKASDIYEVVHAHPTLSEIVLEAAADVDGMATHKTSARRRQ
ncbi:MAG: dihydrolipoyl dehydrogenase [Deltaproteobacteria bacterium]|nr:dihydrolipoyl dehydrogenase [Deltaproteobacteria bacterium]